MRNDDEINRDNDNGKKEIMAIMAHNKQINLTYLLLAKVCWDEDQFSRSQYLEYQTNNSHIQAPHIQKDVLELGKYQDIFPILQHELSPIFLCERKEGERGRREREKKVRRERGRNKEGGWVCDVFVCLDESKGSGGET